MSDAVDSRDDVSVESPASMLNFLTVFLFFLATASAYCIVMYIMQQFYFRFVESATINKRLAIMFYLNYFKVFSTSLHVLIFAYIFIRL